MEEYQEGQLSGVGLSRHSPAGNQPAGPGYSGEQHENCRRPQIIFILPLATGDGNTGENDDRGWQSYKSRNILYECSYVVLKIILDTSYYYQAYALTEQSLHVL